MSKVESNMQVGQEILSESNKPELIVDVEYVNGEKKLKTIRIKSLKELNVALYEDGQYNQYHFDCLYDIVQRQSETIKYLLKHLKLSPIKQLEEETDELC